MIELVHQEVEKAVARRLLCSQIVIAVGLRELGMYGPDLVNKYPGNQCVDIPEHDPSKIPTKVCHPLIAEAINIVLELLETVGIPGQKEDDQALEDCLILGDNQASLE